MSDDFVYLHIGAMGGFVAGVTLGVISETGNYWHALIALGAALFVGGLSMLVVYVVYRLHAGGREGEQ